MSKPDKLQKQVKEICQKSTDANSQCFVAHFKSSTAEIHGCAIDNSRLPSALLLTSDEKGVSVIGKFEEIHINFTSFEDIKNESVQEVAIDFSNINKLKVIYKNGTNLDKIGPDYISNKNLFLLYFEDLNISCMFFCSYDISRKKLIKQLTASNNSDQKDYLRNLIQHYLISHKVPFDTIINKSTAKEFDENES